MKKVFLSLLMAGILLSSSLACAAGYTVAVTATQLGTDSYNFQYSVTTIESVGANQGLDGFLILVPDTAVLSNITSPASYSYGGYWESRLYATGEDTGYFGTTIPAGYIGLYWWGCDPASVYPTGTTATFSFEVDGVSLGSATAAAVTYYGYLTYNHHSYEVEGPVAASAVPAPEPATMTLLLCGVAAIAGFKRRS